ncbi:phospholipase A2-like [Xenopus laevis]|uniref:Phospholipase A2 n=2 Tax=Xenopus laevis TaxID=8355 RepID=A0A1L8EXI6_XENLA|nr:phospholipase A2-like [Xenopus laevis]OCT64048.1 hypothetical protein XELAEV_18045150mg [Xenopus laevis]
MELRIVTLVLLFSSLNGELSKPHKLQRRGLLQLAGAIYCGTGRSAVHYIGYGCHCGLGGKGAPKDNTDWCCHSHDCCYEFAEKYGCKTKMGQYSWTCKDKTVKCGDMQDWCQKIVCKCDSKFARCLSKTRFYSKHVLYPNLLCKKRTPSCRSSKDWFSDRE